MPSGRAGMQGHLPPPPSKPSRESGTGKNMVGLSSPHPRRAHGRLGGSRHLKHGCGRSGPNGRPMSSRGASAPGLYHAVVSRRQPGHAVTFPRASVATGHGNVRSHHLRTASSSTQAEPGGRAGGGTRSVGAGRGAFPRRGLNTAKGRRSGTAVVAGRSAPGACRLSQASVLCPSQLVAHISVLFYRKLGIDYIKNTKVIIVSHFYHKTN